MLQDVEKSNSVCNSNKQKYYRSVFDKFDVNNSGEIELTELVEMLEKDNDVPSIIAKKVFRASDKNKNGVLDYKEFEEMIQDETYEEVFSKYINMYIRYVLPKQKRKVLTVGTNDEVDGVYEESYNCWPPPIAMVFITALELAFFVTDEISRKGSTLNADGVTARIFIYDPFHREEVWRYLTYMFVHVGYMHLIVNLIVQMSLGLPLEMVHKGGRVMVVYFSGVIAGSLGTSVMDPSTYLAGASGGVYALITGHIGTIIMNWNEMEFPLLQLLIFLLVTGIDVGTSIYNRYFLQLEENIGYVAHFSGAMAGLLVGIWNLRNFVPSKRETYIWWCALTIYIIFLGTLILLNIIWTDHFSTR